MIATSTIFAICGLLCVYGLVAIVWILRDLVVQVIGPKALDRVLEHFPPKPTQTVEETLAANEQKEKDAKTKQAIDNALSNLSARVEQTEGKLEILVGREQLVNATRRK